MFCPQCGQEQVSGDLRFCPGCGLPMGLVAELLANGGTLPQLLELAKKKKFFTRKNGIFLSIVWFIFFVPLLTSIWGGVFEVEEMAILSALIGVFGSLLIFLFSLFFLGGSKSGAQQLSIQDQNMQQQNLAGIQGQQGALPPQQTQTAQEYMSPGAGMWKAPDTGDLVQPGSVTEGTTKLLRKEEQND